MMAIKYLFIDIDGTLFDHGTESIPPSALLALHQAHERGHKIFLCTGRANTEIDPMYRSLPISGMILSCGAQIYAENEMVYLGQYPQDALKELVHYMESNQIGFSLDGWKRSFFSEEAFTIFAGFSHPDNEVDSELARAEMRKKNMFHLYKMEEDDYSQILKISIFSKNTEACKELLHHLPTSLEGFIHQNPHYAITNGEISIKGITKATGMQHILTHYQGEQNDTIAFGDSLNDMEMLLFAHIGVCMGNGAKELKKVADYVTSSISEDGLYKAFKHFDLI